MSGTRQPVRVRGFGWGFSALTAGALLMIGGCPIPQVPRDPADNANENANSGDGTANPNTNFNINGDERPIPPIVIDNTNGIDTGVDPNLPDLDDSAAPIAIALTSFESTLNVLPGMTGAIEYEAFGGDPADGALRVQVFYDSDRVDDTGDEVILLNNLPPRGTAEFSTAGIAPGRYFVGVRAGNSKATTTRYAIGGLEIVGPPTLTSALPDGIVRVRASDQVNVRATLQSLARTISWSVFIDVDTDKNGNEMPGFVGGGATVEGTIFPADLPVNQYFIGVDVVDALGQSATFYLALANSDCVNDGRCRGFVIDQPPTIEVTAPMTSVAIQPGAEMVHVEGSVVDPEGNATVTIFRDADSTLNDNEFTVAGPFQLNGPTGLFEADIDTASLFPGNYRFGIKVDDGSGAPVAAYAPGILTILPPPSANAFFFYDPVLVRDIADATSAEVLFFVNDPDRRLSLQPQGITLRIFKDEDFDLVPDDPGAPLIERTSDQDGFPFRPNAVNSFVFDPSVFTLDASQLGVASLIAEVTLRERVGNVTKFIDGGSDIVIVDIEPPTAFLHEALGVETISRTADDPTFDVEIEFFDATNGELNFEVWLVPETDPNLAPVRLTIGSDDVSASDDELPLERTYSVANVPVGTYLLRIDVDDFILPAVQVLQAGTVINVTD